MSSTALPVSERDARVALPARYDTAWRPRFQDAMRARLASGVAVPDAPCSFLGCVAPRDRVGAGGVSADLASLLLWRDDTGLVRRA